MTGESEDGAGVEARVDLEGAPAPATEADPALRPVLVTGATGYVGGRLVPRLLERGHRVRAMARSLRKLEGRPWSRHPRVELVAGDVLDAESLARAADGCSAAYYLVHSMGRRGRDYADADRRGAANMAAAAEAAGLSRVVYLGGLGEDAPGLSAHLRSRHEVARVLREGRVPVTELRAAQIIGSGSASFEILRYLVERLPVMVTPRWVGTPSQPIAIRNVLGYLVGVLDAPETIGGTFDIGGPDVVTYRRLMEVYAEEMRLRRRIVLPVPVLTPRLSSYWIHLVTPAPASIARPLAEGLRNPVVTRDDRIRALVPQRLLSCREAIRLALDVTQHERVESHWTDAGEVRPVEWSQEGDPEWTGGTTLEDERRVALRAPPAQAWRAVSRIGGATGYYHAGALWRLRGALDKLVGGVGLRRGRRHPSELRAGDALDFWRVAVVEPGRRLLLVAEMRVPGRATLEFTLEPADGGGTVLSQRARLQPRGLAGLLYWYALLPLHARVFRGMLRGIARAADRDAARA